ncbi:hypothetical protein [Arthrobacter sp. zg-Y1110]|uniref:hypothetical protein n=1 Tax=Arthrobacter sp. zg-Y1110 TaxID=2886932 RepID=UPI001D133A12|nr:hypothetical protein [Arthrobacter sp. zg-Y1110]MCC3292450.1 hypothetical protein [Arthrobacter sp. zg-Y1110]UWX87117.1 hypothetical protein N2K99_17475 [Arthrobacter sp. zg-Y1110]
MTTQAVSTEDLTVSKREVRKAKRAARPAPTEGQQIAAFLGGCALGFAVFIGFGAWLIMNAPAG